LTVLKERGNAKVIPCTHTQFLAENYEQWAAYVIHDM